MRQTLLNSAKSEDYQLNNNSLILKLEANVKMPDVETVELTNDSEYLNRVRMLWGDSAEWL